MGKINVYLAGGMFCEGDRMYNAYIAKKIRENFTEEEINLYVPQENASINDKTKCADSNAIFWGDYNRLQNTDVLIARIDGDIPPSGTSAEIGIMSQKIQDWNAIYKLAKEDFEDECYEYGINPAENEEIFKKDFYEDYNHRSKIIGLCTDSRNPKRTYLDAKNELMKNSDYESQYCYFNLFTIGCIKVNGELVTSVDEVISSLREYINECK